MNLQLAEAGAVGEIFVGGPGLALGYLNAEASDRSRFLYSRLNSSGDSRLFRTGDLARRRSDGTLEFIGRVDDQVKIRGVRVELGEVRQAFAHVAGVRDAEVVARSDESGEPSLVAYVIAADASRPPTLDAVYRQLRQRLPSQLLPATCTFLSRLPRDANGKLDFDALPRPGGKRQGLEADFVAPRTALEQSLADIWEAALDTRPIGVLDDFFLLGGDSLRAATIAGDIRTRVGKDFSLMSLFDHPTIAELVTVLDVK